MTIIPRLFADITALLEDMHGLAVEGQRRDNAPDMQSVAAVLDWEMATFGNPLQDLAWWNFIDRGFSEALGVPRLEGIPGYDETIARWQRATGLPVDNYHYYEVFAGFRYALILTRVMYATSQYEQLQEHFVAKLLEQVMNNGR